MEYFNVRVYGLLINDDDEVLVSDEQEYGLKFSKFPGGGLELGEGLIDGLKREFMEECTLDIEIISHFYTTDFAVQSAFNNSQIISVYYKVRNLAPVDLNIKTIPFDFDGDREPLQAFRWIKLDALRVADFEFPTDKRVVELLLNEQ